MALDAYLENAKSDLQRLFDAHAELKERTPDLVTEEVEEKFSKNMRRIVEYYHKEISAIYIKELEALFDKV